MNFMEEIRKEENPLKPGLLVEVVDKKRISQMRVAQVTCSVFIGLTAQSPSFFQVAQWSGISDSV